MKKGCLIILLSTVAFFLFGCAPGGNTQTQQLALEEGQETDAKEEPPQEELQQEEETPEAESPEEAAGEEEQNLEGRNFAALGASSGHFNYKLIGAVAGDQNIFYSPYSLAGALALADAGATGASKRELEKVLGITDLAAFEKDYKEYLEKEQSEGARLTTANGIWINDGLQLADDFDTGYKAEAEEYFKAGIKTADFAGSSAEIKKEITEWVRENTENFISDYEASCDKSTVMALINAVYFYGEWLDSFSPEDTEEEDFNGINGKSRVSMMNMSRNPYRHIADYKGITAVALPYKDDNIEMEVLMTSDEEQANDILKLVQSLPEEEFAGLFEELDKADNSVITRLAMPKFEMDETFPSLDEALKKIGIESAYESRDEFSRIAHEIYISQINHRAKLEVDEEGSRAAAITEISFEATSVNMEPEEEVNFIVNRPFVFFIRDRSANNVLFAGFIRDL